MTARSESLGQDLKAWAADQLHIAPGAAPAEIRAAYLRQVQHGNGMANLTAREALLILTGRHYARPALALEAAEDQLQREVDQFTSRFFALPIAERKAEWDRLRARGQAFVRVDARLAALYVGLDVVLSAFDGASEVGRLVATVCELFLLRPVARAARRQEWLTQNVGPDQQTAWTRAARSLRTTHDAIAKLEPELIARLADAALLAKRKKRLRRWASAYREVKETVMELRGWAIAVLIGIGVVIILLEPIPSPPSQRLYFQRDLHESEDRHKPLMYIDDSGEELKEIPGGGAWSLAKKTNAPESNKDKSDPP